MAHSSSGSLSGSHSDPNARDTLLIGIDQNDDPGAVKLAYNDPHGHARTFMMNAPVSAGRVLGDERLFREEDWAYEGRYDAALRECSVLCCVGRMRGLYGGRSRIHRSIRVLL